MTNEHEEIPSEELSHGEVISEIMRGPPKAAFHALLDSKELELTDAERDMFIRRLLTGRSTRRHKEWYSFHVLKNLALPASPLRQELVETVTQREHDSFTFTILADRPTFFSGQPPTDAELKTLATAAYAIARAWYSAEKASTLLKDPEITSRLTSNERKLLGKKVREQARKDAESEKRSKVEQKRSAHTHLVEELSRYAYHYGSRFVYIAMRQARAIARNRRIETKRRRALRHSPK